MRVLVTGGTGVLGRELVARAGKAGHTVRIMSRRAGKSNQAGDVEWARADLRTGEGLAEAVAGVDAVLHAASSPFKRTQEVDVDGTRRLIEAAKTAGTGHLYYVSIVGIDKMTGYPYYQAKLDTERVIEGGGVPWTILRATQFHPLLDGFLDTMLRRGPFLFLPRGLVFQLIDPGEVAEHMVATMADGPSGHIPDIGGPKVETVQEIAAQWVKAAGKRLLRLTVPAFGPAKVIVGGDNTCLDRAVGRITWQEWLDWKYGARS